MVNPNEPNPSTDIDFLNINDKASI